MSINVYVEFAQLDFFFQPICVQSGRRIGRDVDP
jgi:hypothetical protein